MSNAPSQPPEPVLTPSAGSGCATVVMLIFGIILLLPGLCSLAFLVGEIAELIKEGRLALFRDGSMLTLWIIGVAVSAGGVLLIRAALRSRNTNPNQ
jgi:uncharacterized membrane protein YraQ (UPF0718 family)